MNNRSPGRPKIPDDDLEAEFHRVASLDETNDTPTQRDMAEYGKHSPDTYTDRVDGWWDDVVTSYGYEPNDRGGPSGPRITDEQLEAGFHEFAAGLDADRGPTWPEMEEEGPYAPQTYCDRIGGTWDDVLTHYGYEPYRRFFTYSEGELREIMHHVAIETERPPEPEDVPDDVRKDILKRWGSWWVAQEICGVTGHDLEMVFDDGGDSE